MYNIGYDEDNDVFNLNINNNIHEFKASNGLYIHDYESSIESMFNQGVITTVEDNEKEYTKRQVQDANTARDLIRKLGYTSNADTAKLLSNGSIINSPVTSHDLYRAQKIYGPDIGSLKGKTRSSPSAQVKLEYIPPPVSANQSMHVDIFFVEGLAFFASVSTPLGLTMVHYLSKSSRSTTSVEKALLSQINTYKSSGFIIDIILTDGEGAMSKLTDTLNSMSIRVNPSGPGQHVPIIERKIQVIKQSIRAHLATLPFTVPYSILPWLVLFCVFRLNRRPSNSMEDNLSSRERYSGRKIE
jgi:hypothetical protein